MINTINFLYSVETPDTFGGKLSLAFTTLLLGMLTVFGALIVIMLVVLIIGKVFTALDKKKAQKNDENTKVEVTPVTLPETPDAEQNDEELVAAITAAVSVYLEEPVGSFRVVSFRKTKAVPAWNKK